MSAEPAIRPARRSDAADMALLINIAGHGMPLMFWSSADGADELDSPFEIGRLRARRDEGSFSWRNASMATIDDEVIGMLLGYREPDTITVPEPSGAGAFVDAMNELEAEAPGTWYINVLAVYHNWRGKGVGARLMGVAESEAAGTGARGLSLIAADDNQDALRFYDRHGFNVRDSRKDVPMPKGPDRRTWLLMIKD